MPAFDFTIFETAGPTNGCEEDSVDKAECPAWKGDCVGFLYIVGDFWENVGEMWTSCWVVIVEVTKKGVRSFATVGCRVRDPVVIHAVKKVEVVRRL